MSSAGGEVPHVRPPLQHHVQVCNVDAPSNRIRKHLERTCTADHCLCRVRGLLRQIVRLLQDEFRDAAQPAF